MIPNTVFVNWSEFGAFILIYALAITLISIAFLLYYHDFPVDEAEEKKKTSARTGR